jgi:hypothetical protein
VVNHIILNSIILTHLASIFRLIAIMLGRLRMSVADCISAYMELSGEVFQEKHYLPVKLNGELRGRFDTKALENAIKKIIRSRGGDEDLLMKDTGQPSTKTYVLREEGYKTAGRFLYLTC